MTVGWLKDEYFTPMYFYITLATKKYFANVTNMETSIRHVIWKYIKAFLLHFYIMNSYRVDQNHISVHCWYFFVCLLVVLHCIIMWMEINEKHVSLRISSRRLCSIKELYQAVLLAVLEISSKARRDRY